jgi:outer membrane protein insertion porin family
MPTAPHRRPAFFAAVLVCMLAAPAAVAAESGAVDVAALATWTGRRVATLELEGVPKELTSRALDGLALKPRRKLLRLRKPLLDLKTAQADARRLRLLMARNGFPQAEIEGSGAVANEDEVAVTFIVRPGPAVIYGEVSVEGMPESGAAAADSVHLALPRGARFREAAIFGVRDDLILAMRRAGHPRAEVELSVSRPDSSTADIRFACEPGLPFVYHDFVQEGAPEDLVGLVDKTVRLEENTPYSPRVADDAQRFLRDLELFRQIRLTNVVHDSTSLDLKAELRARKMLTVEASVGTFTDNPVVVTGYVLHRNIFKGGRAVGVGASYATHYRWVEGGTLWQGVPIARARTDLKLRYEIEDEDAYRLDTKSAVLSALFSEWRYSSLRLALEVSDGILESRSEDETSFPDDVGLQTVLAAKWYRDTSDNPLDPLTGSRITLETSWSPPGFWTDNPFASLRAVGSRYLHLGGERVLALRLDTAVAWPLGDALDVTPNRRWFAGGVSTMRGYGRRRLGPLDSEGKPIGGESRLLAGMEYRMPLASVFRWALFLDTGQVWRYVDDISLAGYQAAAGVGLMIGTPVGPVRFDLARLLTEPSVDEPNWKFHFAIGHPF